jgi:hypothetical protein
MANMNQQKGSVWGDSMGDPELSFYPVVCRYKISPSGRGSLLIRIICRFSFSLHWIPRISDAINSNCGREIPVQYRKQMRFFPESRNNFTKNYQSMPTKRLICRYLISGRCWETAGNVTVASCHPRMGILKAESCEVTSSKLAGRPDLDMLSEVFASSDVTVPTTRDFTGGCPAREVGELDGVILHGGAVGTHGTDIAGNVPDAALETEATGCLDKPQKDPPRK